MDTAHIATQIHSLTSAFSRRGLLAGLTGGVLSLPRVGGEDADARNGKRKKRRKNKRKNRGDKAKVRVDATCPSADPARGVHPASGTRIAQSFTAIRSGELVKVTIPMLNQLATTGDVVLRLSPVDETGLPTNAVLAEATATMDVPPGEDTELLFVFSDPFTVTAGVDYALVIPRLADDDFSWRRQDETSCSGAFFFSLNLTGPFELFGDDLDLSFTTFVKSRAGG